MQLDPQKAAKQLEAVATTLGVIHVGTLEEVAALMAARAFLKDLAFLLMDQGAEFKSSWLEPSQN